MISSLFIVTTAADEDSGVSYSIALEASRPASGTSYQIGETVTVTVAVSTKDAMGQTDPDLIPAPIYAFNGVLNYDPFLLSVKDFVIPSDFKSMMYKNDDLAGKVSFSYLCSNVGSELAGTKVSADFILIKVNFTTLKDGTSAVSLSDMLFTDKSAGTRPIVSSTTKADISIGTGETVADAQTLAKSIADAKEELEAAVMNPSAELVYPAFSVTKAAHDALDEAIKLAEEALSAAILPDEFLEAENALSSALRAYEAAKVYGKAPGGSGGLLPGLTEKQTIEVTASAIGNGKILNGYENQLVRYGTSVTVMAIPEDGYEVEKVVVNGKQYSADDIVTIASVTAKTHIEFYFREKAEEPKAPRFTDVAPGSWYFDAVEKIAEMGLFAGTSETEFSPDMPMTRAMLVTVLHRLDGKPSVSADVKFGDVAPGEWYTDAIAWASTNGIVNGYTADTFGTNDSISRQDMVTILYRYLRYKGLTPAAGAALDAYTDANMLSDYAKPAMEWANATGLVKGTSDTTLSPKDNCTRAQVATIILRYTENISAN